MKKPSPRNYYKILLLVGLVIILLLGKVLGLYSRKSPEKSEITSTAEQNIDLIERVAKLIMIPDERPVVATINESSKLSAEQAFYMGSQDGDKLIIFPNSKKAIIYSPVRNIIVNSGPFQINSGTTQ